MLKKMYDLHIHSIYSDGENTIDELLELFHNHSIEYFSITDHDNIDAVYELNKKNIDIPYIKGVEISSLLDHQYRLHILGYNFDEHNKELISLLDELKQLRFKRFKELIIMLEELYSITFNRSDINHILNTVNIPGKPHIASLMMQYGYIDSIKEGFDRYLKDLYPKTDNSIDALRVIDTIHKADGIVLLAHPKKYEDKYNIDFTVIMDRLLESGIDGIEIYNSLHNYEDCIRYYDYALKHNLITSGGSDFHGIKIKPHVLLAMMNKQFINDLPINIISSVK